MKDISYGLCRSVGTVAIAFKPFAAYCGWQFDVIYWPLDLHFFKKGVSDVDFYHQT